MDKDGLTCLGGVAFLDQEGCGHALQHHRGALFEGDRIRHFHQAIGLDGAGFGIGANRTCCVGNAIAHLYLGHAFTNRFHNA